MENQQVPVPGIFSFEIQQVRGRLSQFVGEIHHLRMSPASDIFFKTDPKVVIVT